MSFSSLSILYSKQRYGHRSTSLTPITSAMLCYYHVLNLSGDFRARVPSQTRCFEGATRSFRGPGPLGPPRYSTTAYRVQCLFMDTVHLLIYETCMTATQQLLCKRATESAERAQPHCFVYRPPVRPIVPICPSICHTGGSIKNVGEDYAIFTVQ